ncbi:uncharacterized protein LOC117306877 [Asterias rubens]|uniref:uncharacterized protein LOC117306877 n=1 Tax=Asterias rubens TaxID=7604 RepID=UPI001455D068|nr:uncharacterized protein LOC117306877 [Asterias rubens]XP_033647330.1 uncharacterized protein LOC117306877 [Asterias rubens]
MARPSDLVLRESNNSVSMPPIVPVRSPVVANRMHRGASGGGRGKLDEARNYEFYFGKIPNNQVEELLKPHMEKRGAFLLRDSNTEEGMLTISVVDNPKHIYHFKVKCTSTLIEVTDKLKFHTLKALLDYFQINEVPGRDTSQLKLIYPVNGHSRRRSASPPLSPFQKAQSPKQTLDQVRPASYRQSVSPRQPRDFLDSRNPVPIPEPGREPVYFSNDHIYCRAEDLTRSKLEDLKKLCELSDLSNKKCTCGLYMDESVLVDDWMMHIDKQSSDDHAGSGRLFFVNTLTNETTWRLPDSTMASLERLHPDKYTHVLQLLS